METKKLQEILHGEVSTAPADLQHYSRDASIFEITPEVIVHPKDTEDIKRLVKYVSQEKISNPKLSLTARSGGTCMTGGSINDSIILDFTTHMNHMGVVENGSVWSEPGRYYRDFEKATLQDGWLMPSYPASRAICAIGGMVGNNAGGEKSLSYGQVKDWVTDVAVVLADGQEYTFGPINTTELEKKLQQANFEGEVYRFMHDLLEKKFDLIGASKPSTSKNSAGYLLWDVWDKKTFDLSKLFVGSQGTLGIITRTTFKLIQPKPYSKLLVILLPDEHSLGRIVGTIKQHQPESFELYDDHTLKLALTFLPEMMKKMGGKTLRLLWQFLPELWMSFTGGMPKLVLLAEFTGNTEGAVLANAQGAAREVHESFGAQTHLAKSEQEAKKYWTIRRESYNLLRTHSPGKVSACFIEDIVVHPDQLPEFLPRLNAIFAKHNGFTYTIAGHAGDANFHIMPLMNLADEAERKAVLEMSEEVFSLVREFHGSITAEHNDGIVRGPYLHKMYSPEILTVFAEVKKFFDPLNIFNPHKKTDANLDFFMQHMRKT